MSFQKLQKGKHKMKWEKFNQKLRDKNKLQKWELVVEKLKSQCSGQPRGN